MTNVVSAQSKSNSTIIDPLARTTPISISGSYDAYQQQRDAIKALADSGIIPINGYELSKAIAWLEVSFHEYTRNDRSGFAPEALLESQRITQFLSGKPVAEPPAAVNGGLGVATANPASQTLLINGGQRLRSDLWSRANTYKESPSYGGSQACGERQIANAEVQLAHAGNEINQQGWRHARPYIQLAEIHLDAAKKALDSGCMTALVSAPTLPNPVIKAPLTSLIAPPSEVKQAPVTQSQATNLPSVESVAVVKQVIPDIKPMSIVEPKLVKLEPAAPTPVNLAVEVLFNFGKYDLYNVRDYTQERLDDLIAQIKAARFTVKQITLTGHADRVNATGKTDYNVVLSQERALTVKKYMVSKGIDAKLITTDYKADSVQVEACTRKFKHQSQFEECLLPNRRVEVKVQGFKP